MNKLAMVAALAFLGVVTLQVRADVITLTDGRIINGSIHKTDDGWVIVDSTGKQISVPEDQVKSIALTPRVSSESADERLDSLRHSVDSMSDIAQIITRYNQFISQYPTGAGHDEAVKDLATWQDRKAKGLVKFGTAWITPAELAQRQQQSSSMAVAVATLIVQGQMKEAAAQLQPILAADPHNAAALYLRGSIQYTAGALPLARNDFEAVVTTSPNHGPSLNNIGVIFFRQKQWGPSLNNFYQAMIAMPQNQTILDNLVEVFNDLPADAKDTALAKKTARLFAEQDPALQQQMAAHGLSRWGSSWIDQNQMAAIHQAQINLDSKLAELESQFRAAQAQIGQIDQQINANNVQMLQYQTGQPLMRDNFGNIVQTPYPSQYYALQTQNDSLTLQKQNLQAQMSSYQQQGETAKKQVPTPQLNGIVHLYATDGVNSLLGPAATQPSVDAGAAAAAAAVTPAAPAPSTPPMPVPPALRLDPSASPALPLPPPSPSPGAFPPVTPAPSR